MTSVRISSHDDPGHGHVHEYEREHAPGADHGSGTIRHDQDILAKNDRLAAQNRDWLLGRSVLGLNLVSSPGAGKTTLNPRLQVFQVSATRGDGLESWYGWLADRLIALRSPLHEVHAAG
jgi:hypothetical protein